MQILGKIRAGLLGLAAASGLATPAAAEASAIAAQTSPEAALQQAVFAKPRIQDDSFQVAQFSFGLTPNALQLFNKAVSNAPGPTLDTSLGVFSNTDSGIGTTTPVNGGLQTKKWTISGWFWGADNTTTTYKFNTLAGPSVVRHGQTGGCETGATAADGICWSVDSSAAKVQLTHSNSTGVATTDRVLFAGNSAPPPAPWVVGVYNWIFVSCDSTSGVQACGMAFNGVDGVASGSYTQSAVPADLLFDMFSPGGLGFINFQSSNTAMGYQGPFYMTDEAMVCTAAGFRGAIADAGCAAKGAISATVISKFWTNTGNPRSANGGAAVYLGASGELPTGTAARVYYRGDGSDMLTNHGSATSGDLSVLANIAGGYIGRAPYGPSGIPSHRVTQKWAQGQNTGGVSSLVTSATGFPISTGDLLVIWAEFSDSSTIDHTPITCTSANSTWTAFGSIKDVGHAVTAGGCYAFAGAGETGVVTIVGANMPSTRTSQWAMFDYVNVSAVETPPAGLTTASSANLSSPANTTLNANDTCSSAVFNTNAATHTIGQPSGGDFRWKTVHSGSLALILAWDEFFASAGSQTQRTVPISANDSGIGGTLCMVPN